MPGTSCVRHDEDRLGRPSQPVAGLARERCHDAETKKGDFDLTALKPDLGKTWPRLGEHQREVLQQWLG